MDIKPWSEVKISEPEAVLFLYLMFRKDYGYHIAQEFSKAIENNKWDERRGLSSLKHENKVSGLLFGMARKNLLFELPGPGVGRPKNNSIKADMVENPRRKYYRVNPNVLGMSHLVVLTEKEIKEIREYIRQDEHFGFDPEELLPEQYADLAIFFVYGTSSIESEMGAFFHSSKTVRSALHTLELCAPDVLSCIQFINTLKKYDYLTILMTARAMFKKIHDYISPDSYALTFDCLKEIIPTDGSEEELKVWIRKWFDKKLNRITNDKERYIQSKINHVLAHKELASLLKSNLPFLHLYKIDNEIEEVRKKDRLLRVSKEQMIGSLIELGVTKESIISGDLCSIIKNMDTIIYQTPYIERGIGSPSNYTPKANQRT
jgi:hypothetical protein